MFIVVSFQSGFRFAWRVKKKKEKKKGFKDSLTAFYFGMKSFQRTPSRGWVSRGDIYYYFKANLLLKIVWERKELGRFRCRRQLILESGRVLKRVLRIRVAVREPLSPGKKLHYELVNNDIQYKKIQVKI